MLICFKNVKLFCASTLTAGYRDACRSWWGPKPLTKPWHLRHFGTLLYNEASLLFVSPSSASVYSPEGLSIRLSAKKSKTFGKGRLGNKGKHRKPETNANNIAKLQHRAVSICHFTCFALGYLSLWKPEITHLWYDPSARRTHILGTHTHTHTVYAWLPVLLSDQLSVSFYPLHLLFIITVSSMRPNGTQDLTWGEAPSYPAAPLL